MASGRGRDVSRLHQPLEAVLDAEDLEALVDRLDGRGRDDRVDAGRGAAADKDCQLSS